MRPTLAAAPRAVGLGLKALHLPEILGRGAAVEHFEVHAENLMVAGGAFLRSVVRVRERYPLSLHGVGLSLGGLEPPDDRHLARLRALVDRFEPFAFSEHLAWSGHGGVFYNDLLPLPYDRATLERVVRHVQILQDALGTRVLIENPSTYVAFEASTMSEGEFLAALARRSGCGLLLDVNNAVVSAVNHGLRSEVLIEPLLALPAGTIGEIHLAGHREDRDAAGDRLWIDDHGSPVGEAAWALYERVLGRIDPVPVVIERDNAVPPLAELEAEAARARSCAGRHGRIDPGGVADRRQTAHEATP